MILSGNEIKKNVENGDIVIKPFKEENLNPNSYNLTLDNELLVYEEDVLDMRRENKTTRVVIPEEGLVIEPGKLYLGKTVEYTATDKYAPMLDGRSSIGRLGMSVHSTAGFGDVGFAGTWTLQIRCTLPIRIYPNTKVCQIYYHCIQGDTEILYRGKYYNQHDPTASRIYTEMK